MARDWSFGQKVGAGFALIVMIAISTGVVAVYALNAVVAVKDEVITVDAAVLVSVEQLRTAFERKVASSRGYLLGREERFVESMLQARGEFEDAHARVLQLVVEPEDRRLAESIGDDEDAHDIALDRLIKLRGTDSPLETILRSFEEDLFPKRDQLFRDLGTLSSRLQDQLESSRADSTRRARSATGTVTFLVVATALIAVAVAFGLARTIGRQIGTAVAQVQSSSSELQATANQQATGAREQATAMNEISTTISELLATSRQIAESAQRVAQIAEQTAGSARSGEVTVGQAQESIAGIRRQVDQVVGHMLELGKKSQQIGAVLEIVAELAEQTNILAINATIEAAGAGESGRRFAVVADEIRKLADRVAGSTKEIRSLIEDVRGAVNTTVMATETGSKVVEAGSRQFGDVASAFRQIAGLVATTTDASREIELSTKQQATAVEQVNVAITNVAQATKEAEAGSAQTLATVSQLASLSRDLRRVVQPKTAA